MNYILTTKTEAELYHHGTKGMKWGQRLYQRKDGSLTALGQKRYNRAMKKAKAESARLKEVEKNTKKLSRLDSLQKANEAKKKALYGSGENSKAANSKPKVKSINDMSDDELRSRLNRLQMEQQYMSMVPEQTSKGKKIVKSTLNNVVKPAVEDIGKQITKSLLTKLVNNMVENPELKVYTNNKKKS